MAKLFGYRWYQTNRQLLMGHADMPWSIDDKSFEAIENPGCAITYKTFKSTNGYVRRISVFLPIDFGKFLRSTPENQKHLECHEPNLVEKLKLIGFGHTISGYGIEMFPRDELVLDECAMYHIWELGKGDSFFPFIIILSFK